MNVSRTDKSEAELEDEFREQVASKDFVIDDSFASLNRLEEENA